MISGTFVAISSRFNSMSRVQVDFPDRLGPWRKILKSSIIFLSTGPSISSIEFLIVPPSAEIITPDFRGFCCCKGVDKGGIVALVLDGGGGSGCCCCCCCCGTTLCPSSCTSILVTSLLVDASPPTVCGSSTTTLALSTSSAD